MRLLIPICCLLLLLASPNLGWSQAEAEPKVEAQAEEPEVPPVDYEKARFEHAAEEGYNPYAIGAIEKVMVDEAMKHWWDREQAKAFEVFEELLEIYPFSIEAHRRMADGFAVILEQEDLPLFRQLEAKHREAYQGILASIMKEGRDGLTGQTAYPVIIISEEYWVVYALGFEVIDRRSDLDKGFDIFRVKDKEGNEREVYFDISRIRKAAEALAEKNQEEASVDSFLDGSIRAAYLRERKQRVEEAELP